jgi:hypothetical protein
MVEPSRVAQVFAVQVQTHLACLVPITNEDASARARL